MKGNECPAGSEHPFLLHLSRVSEGKHMVRGDRLSKIPLQLIGHGNLILGLWRIPCLCRRILFNHPLKAPLGLFRQTHLTIDLPDLHQDARGIRGVGRIPDILLKRF